ncbi:MAG: serine hydrolase [Proteobacteria bacterium]|nr:serine hydrolase [Pseudomonadota bacterium]MBU1708900.1 serine hydrolase [Pseudomonadota bacterium]
MRYSFLVALVMMLSFAFAMPGTVCARKKTSETDLVVLASKHKYNPNPVEKQVRSRTRTRVVQLAGDSKSKPENSSEADTLDIRNKLSSKSVYLMDASTGESIYTHSPDEPAQPASTIKVLTGLLAIKYLTGNELVEVSRRASQMPSSKIYLEPGKSYNANDLINAVLLSSANDASVALAEKIAGSEKSFAKLMNHKAQILGATNTVCKNSTGLTSKGQVSTARDLAQIFAKAMDNKEFAERMAKVKVRTRFGKVLRNHNKALWEVDGAEGGKTGYTKAARQTYVGKFKRGDVELVVAVLGSETMWDDVRTLVEYGFARKGMGLDPSSSVASNDKDSEFDLPAEQQAMLVADDQMKISKL